MNCLDSLSQISPLNRPQPDFVDSIEEAIARFASYAQEAVTAGNQELAERWTLATQAAKDFSYYHFTYQQNFLGKIHASKDLPLAAPWNDSIKNTQISARYITESLAAAKNGNMNLAQELALNVQAISEATALYHYWSIRANQEALLLFHVDEHSVAALALHYRSKALEATAAQNSTLAQQWAEAACLAQGSVRKTKIAQATHTQLENKALANRWTLAAYWNYLATILRANVAQALEQGDSILAHYWHEAAIWAENASTYRVKVVSATLGGNNTLANYWTTAACWAGNTSNYKKFALEARQREEKEVTHQWSEVALHAEQAAIYYTKAAQSAMKWFGLPTYYWRKMGLRAEKAVTSS